jgi:hypothetical protein
MRSRLLAPLLAFAVLAPAGAAPADTPPVARAAAQCGDVKTRNGGLAEYVYANKVRCSLARSVARRANGRTFKALGFTCRPRNGIYGCNKPGTFKGIGFSYRRP